MSNIKYINATKTDLPKIPNGKFLFGWFIKDGSSTILVPKYASLKDNDYVQVNSITETSKNPDKSAKYIGIIVNEPNLQFERPRATVSRKGKGMSVRTYL